MRRYIKPEMVLVTVAAANIIAMSVDEEYSGAKQLVKKRSINFSDNFSDDDDEVREIL